TIDGLARGQDERRTAVDDAAGVAGGDGAVFLERGRQLRQNRERCLRPHVIVSFHELYALARLDLDRHDLVGEAACLPRLVGELLAAEREGVLLVPRDA